MMAPRTISAMMQTLEGLKFNVGGIFSSGLTSLVEFSDQRLKSINNNDDYHLQTCLEPSHWKILNQIFFEADLRHIQKFYKGIKEK
jgi:hypothetical protein